MAAAWHQAHLIALAKTKHFPKSPAAYPPRGEDEEESVETMVAGAKARFATQQVDSRLQKMGRDRVIMREEE